MAPPPASPFSVAPDGAALDPAAFRTAMRSDAARLAALKTDDPAVAALVLGDDTDALQARGGRDAGGVTCIGPGTVNIGGPIVRRRVRSTPGGRSACGLARVAAQRAASVAARALRPRGGGRARRSIVSPGPRAAIPSS